MQQKKKWLIIGICIVLFFYGFTKYVSTYQLNQYVNVYDWYGMLSKDILDDFHKETGIKVRYDVYESNDVLATKLFTGASGYDIVFPSATPHLHSLIESGAIEKLDHQELGIDLLTILDKELIKQFSDTDEHIDYFIPYYWGTIGIVFNEKKLDQYLPKNIKRDTWGLLFDPTIASYFKKGGISLLEEAIDVIPSCGLFLKIDTSNTHNYLLKRIEKQLRTIRPFIKSINATKFINDLVMEDIMIAQAWSSEATQAIEEAKEQGINLRYIIPKEGALVWIDGICIAKNAPHKKNAYTFIRFLLRPSIAARITQNRHIGSFINNIKKYLPQNIINNPSIYPSNEIIKKLSIYPNPKSVDSQRYEKHLLDVWASIRFS
jgi:putrescine transport system substrate-binding protein